MRRPWTNEAKEDRKNEQTVEQPETYYKEEDLEEAGEDVGFRCGEEHKGEEGWDPSVEHGGT